MDWEQFRIDPVFDNRGTVHKKLLGFMHAFIDEQAHNNVKPAVRKKAAKKKTTDSARMENHDEG